MVERYYSRCPRCGAAGDGAIRFCRNCGASLSIPPYFMSYPPGRHERRALALPLIIGAMLLAMLVVGGVVILTLQRWMGYGPAKVVSGAPLAWRSINWTPDPNNPPDPFLFDNPLQYTDLSIGDFDGDHDDELYLCSYRGANQIELDGAVKFIKPANILQGVKLTTWDYNQDGIDELLQDAGTGSDEGIYDTQCTMLAHLPGFTAMWGAITGDVDGDGKPDLLLEDRLTSEVFAYAPGGKRIWHATLPAGTYNQAFGDVDGDRRAEMIVLDNGQLRLSGIGQKEQLVPGWPGYDWPVAVIDLDGDGKGEVFESNASYHNLATGQVTVLRYGKQGKRRSTEAATDVYLARLPVTSAPCLATIGLNNYSMNSELFLFDKSGACIYEERFGSPVRKFGVAHKANGSDCLVVLTENKLLVYP
jgi:hypothetical protein